MTRHPERARPVQVSLRISEEEQTRAEALAAEDGEPTVAAWLRSTLLRALEERGPLNGRSGREKQR